MLCLLNMGKRLTKKKKKKKAGKSSAQKPGKESLTAPSDSRKLENDRGERWQKPSQARHLRPHKHSRGFLVVTLTAALEGPVPAVLYALTAK